MTPEVRAQRLRSLRTFRGYNEAEAELAAWAADEIEDLETRLEAAIVTAQAARISRDVTREERDTALDLLTPYNGIRTRDEMLAYIRRSLEDRPEPPETVE